MENEDLSRPALRLARIAKLPPGRKRLPPRWWEDPEMPSGTTLLAREECRRRRAAHPLKHKPDLVALKEARGYARWAWTYAPDALDWPSEAMH